MFKILITAAILGLLAIILGAFGAHALQEILTSEQLESFKTGVSYQMTHVLVIFFIWLGSFFTEKQAKTLSIIFISAIVLFSGSIYLLNLTNIPARTIWFVTPLGGLLFMVGWSYMIYIFFKKSRNFSKK